MATRELLGILARLDAIYEIKGLLHDDVYGGEGC